jgi:hypothetical protein
LGVHFFFLAPLLHVAWDYWMRYVIPPPDWRPWLGGMAILNCLGLIIYRMSRETFFQHSMRKKARQTVWQLDQKRLTPILLLSLVITAGLQILVYRQYGGLSGYVAAYEAREEAFEGMGWFFMLSESFPILAMMGFAFYGRNNMLVRTWPVLAVVLVVFLLLQMLFGGLRGSRSNTVWALFWAVGIIHFWIRPVPRKLIYAGVIFLVLFMYLYGFYKGVGSQALYAFEGAEARVELAEETGRSLESTVLGDLGRSDVQALLLHNLVMAVSDYEYAWGRTYLGAVALLIPRALWPERPPTKVKEGTEAQYGMGWYVPDTRLKSSRVYGLAGEAMLNFSPVAVPFTFVLLGLSVGYVRRLLFDSPPFDARLFLFPFCVNFCFALLTSDSDNLLFFSIKNAAVAFLVIGLSSRRDQLR